MKIPRIIWTSRDDEISRLRQQVIDLKWQLRLVGKVLTVGEAVARETLA